MNLLKKFYDKKKQEWYDRRYRKGFASVCSGYFIDKNDLIHHYQIGRSRIDVVGENPFDRGILDACHALQNIRTALFTHQSFVRAFPDYQEKYKTSQFTE